MKQIAIIIVLLFTQFNRNYACLNGNTKVLADGKILHSDRVGNVPRGHDILLSDDMLENHIRELDSLYKKTKYLDYLSDKGLLLILLKRYDEAAKLYLSIEQLEPGRYSTASNIGTAYELLGQNEKALNWIKKAVEIDSASHRNSEWIHVNILEAKIKGPGYITSTFLLNTDFGTAPTPTTDLKKNELRQLFEALYYQLNERVTFVEPKDPIVAELYFDLGNIAFLSDKYVDALADYEQAKKYGFSDQLIEQRIEAAKKLMKKTKQAGNSKGAAAQESNFLNFRLGIAGALLLTSLAIIIYRRKRKNKA